MREKWLRYHRYLALGAGLFFALLGLTGSLSVYRTALDELLNPQLVIDAPGKEYLPLDRIMAAVRQAHPRRDGAWTLEMPTSERGMMTAWYEQPHETIGEYYAPLMVSVNPYSAEVVASRFWGATATTWLLDLHTQLCAGRRGWNAVGALAVLLMLSLVSGLYLWWPGRQRLWQALALRHDLGVVRLAFDLHRAVGLSAALALFLAAFTGFHLSYPALLETLTGAPGMHHGTDSSDIRSTAVPNNTPVRLGSAEFIARSPFPSAELRRITTPDGNAGVYRVNFRQIGELNRTHPFTLVWVDRWSGQIQAVRNAAQFSAGQTFMTWIWPLHTGEAYGATGRFIWFIAGLTPLLLYVSGVLCWLHRRGLFRDRPVDFALLWAWGRRMAGASYRWSVDGWRIAAVTARLLIRRALTVKIGDATLEQWLHRWLARHGYRLERWWRNTFTP
ncbi:MAG: PepSY domain-containing protein [Methylococcaceae bacterium]|nr:MAG: PepSY domain-containing protein [Methylococcaceae bacterium]